MTLCFKTDLTLNFNNILRFLFAFQCRGKQFGSHCYAQATKTKRVRQ